VLQGVQTESIDYKDAELVLVILETELFDIYYKNVQMYVIRWNEYYFMKKGK
jgi:hypothetical protein